MGSAPGQLEHSCLDLILLGLSPYPHPLLQQLLPEHPLCASLWSKHWGYTVNKQIWPTALMGLTFCMEGPSGILGADHSMPGAVLSTQFAFPHQILTEVLLGSNYPILQMRKLGLREVK